MRSAQGRPKKPGRWRRSFHFHLVRCFTATLTCLHLWVGKRRHPGVSPQFLLAKIFVAAFFLFLGQGLQAAPTNTAEHALESIRQTKTKILKNETRKRSILAEIYNLGKKIKELSEKKAQLQQNKMMIEGNAKSLADLIAQLEGTIKEQRQRLRVRLRSLYKLGGVGFLKVFFSSASATDLDRNMKMLRKITANDYRLLKNYHANRDQLEVRHQELRKEARQFLAMKRNIETVVSDLEKENEKKSVLIKRIDHSLLVQLKDLQNWREKIGDDKLMTQGLSELAQWLKPSFFEKKGNLPPPVHGKLLQGFGLIDYPSHPKIREIHKGNFYKTKKETPIRAVSEGQVVYVGPIFRDVLSVVIDHGDHYYTTYSFLKDTAVESGEQVKKAQVLGQTGYSTLHQESGLYFEIRHFSEPEDPQEWLGASPVQLSRGNVNETPSRGEPL